MWGTVLTRLHGVHILLCEHEINRHADTRCACRTQVRFGVLNAGNYGVSQSRKRTFIWGVAPGNTLPDWPAPLHVFRSPQLTIKLPGGAQVRAVPPPPASLLPLMEANAHVARQPGLPSSLGSLNHRLWH